MMTEVYPVIASVEELNWFFDHVIQRPAVNESYSAVFVSRHKKLTKEQQEELGLTRKESEFLATVTFKLRAIKDAQRKDDQELWTFDQFLKALRRLEVNKLAYTTAKGEPIPTSTISTIFYVNPSDDMKVCRKFVEEYNDVNEAISKATLNGKSISDNYQSYQWFGKAENAIKHLRANQKGTRYWLDFDLDVPDWFKEKNNNSGNFYFDSVKNKTYPRKYSSYYYNMIDKLDATFGRSNYVIISTSGGYHILVRTNSIRSNPHDFCKEVEAIYKQGVADGNPEYLDEKGLCKFECIVNDSQIPGLPLPGTYQYDRKVTVLNKEDFE